MALAAAAVAWSPLVSFCGRGITTGILLLSECFADVAFPFFAAIALVELLDLPLPMISIGSM